MAQQHPYLRNSNGRRDLIAVDHWMDDLLGSNKLVNLQIQFSADDAEDVARVRFLF
jgi:hypothetical protein